MRISDWSSDVCSSDLLISYMRTDSVNLSAEALGEIRDVIARDFGTKALPDKPNFYTTKSKNAQEAHEAVRPTSALRTPAQVARFLSDDERRLYELVWKRAVASQMVPATLRSEEHTSELQSL